MIVKLVMRPSPESATGSQARWWHAPQNSLGGMARAPQRVHRMPVNVPSRARSKNWPSVRDATRGASGVAEQTHENGGGVATEGVHEAGARTLHLTRSCFTPELGDNLGDLCGSSGADGMALGLESAGRIDGNLTPQARPALLGRDPACPRLEQAEPFGGDDLGDGEAVVQ